MSARVLLEGLGGVRSVIVGNDQGHLEDTAGDPADAEDVASSIAVVLRALEPLGDAVGLGTCNLLTIRSASLARVVGRQRRAIAVVDVDARRPTAEIESRLRSLSWAPAEERPSPHRVTTAPASPVSSGDADA